MYAVIKNGGRQYKVTVGDRLEVNRLAVTDGEQISISEVLLISDADSSTIGAPYVENAAVLATVLGQARGEKLIVFRYKSKKRFRHKKGHRQELTVLSIDDIVANGKSLVTGEAPKTREVIDTTDSVVPEERATTTDADRKTRRRRPAEVEGTESSAEE